MSNAAEQAPREPAVSSVPVPNFTPIVKERRSKALLVVAALIVLVALGFLIFVPGAP